MSRNITGCSVTSISASGVRQVLIRLRLASASEWRTSRNGRGFGAASTGADGCRGRDAVDGGSCRDLLAVGGVVSAAVRPVRVKKTSSRLGRCRESSVTAMPAAASRATASVSASSSLTGTASTPLRISSAGAPDATSARISRGRLAGRAGSDGPHLEGLAADDPLEPVGGVVRDDPAVVDDGDLVGERVGLLQVLRGQQHRRPVGDQRADDVPHVLALGRVEAGRRLVEEDHVRAADQARGQVEPPAHAAGVGLGRPVGGLGQVEPLEQLGGPLPGAARGRRSSRVPKSTRFCRPVRSSSTEAYWPVRPIAARTRSASRTTSKPATGRARRRAQQGGEDADGGGLAGAVGAEHAEHGARGDGEVDALQRPRLPEALDEALGLDHQVTVMVTSRARGR